MSIYEFKDYFGFRYEMNLKKLRSDLMDYYGSAMYCGFPMAVMELGEVERASEEELLEMAKKHHIDLRKYLERII